ncbi:hypothetical protein Val02_41700 [Virgisporangium aliadipatigenens]|uniref:Uncharacterized protein n=1 Tax=Virgisporangium aliadipatigenens TaxID=741659 RepID=A0A8J3YKX7_9ACTN|nr:hypothetical protein [Virgisporangium aliadipatigenens]GIJ47284.1 hypothetical protein Val02_41700 [Virgisporangium aliadipatigenens]
MTVPRVLTESELSLALGKGVTAPQVGGRPTLDPPGAAATAGAAAGAAAGFVSARILSLFTTADGRNGWINVEGVGWRRLATAGDSGHTNLAQLGAAARMQGNAASINIGADDVVREIYVW